MIKKDFVKKITGERKKQGRAFSGLPYKQVPRLSEVPKAE